MRNSEIGAAAVCAAPGCCADAPELSPSASLTPAGPCAGMSELSPSALPAAPGLCADAPELSPSASLPPAGPCADTPSPNALPEPPAVPVGRFAPSPSGRMHLGNLACSLLAWLSAKSRGGKILLRIEDLDAERCPRAYADALEADLLWLGLPWDEGGSAGGPHTPYYQSECAPIYDAAYAKLAAKGLVYPCFCSRAALHAASAPHRSDGDVIYPGTCRCLTPAEVAEKRKTKAPAWRVRVPAQTIAFTDGHLGPYAENLARDCGDFTVRRGDGVYAYQLAVTVDDARMGVTEVVRGADLLSSTPRQLYLYHVLGRKAPAFYHCPLLLAPGGRRLSKRDGDDSLENLRARYTAPEIIGRLAYLYGLLPAPVPATPQSLLSSFSWEKVPMHDIEIPAGLL